MDPDEPEPDTDHAADEADVDEGHDDIDGVYVPGADEAGMPDSDNHGDDYEASDFEDRHAYRSCLLE